MGQFLNKKSTFFRAEGQNAAVDPAEFVRKGESDAGMSGRAPLIHAHDADDVDGLTDAVLLIIHDIITDSQTVYWDREPGARVSPGAGCPPCSARGAR